MTENCLHRLDIVDRGKERKEFPIWKDKLEELQSQGLSHGHSTEKGRVIS